jgi:hypothetical protein
MTNEVDEMSAASRGSQPVAWAIMVRGEYRDIWDTREQAKERADGITYWDGDDLVTASVQPLYRQPTLTDEEREAIEKAIGRELDAEWYGGPEPDRVVALRGLLERLG